jgi:hypothetical protein
MLKLSSLLPILSSSTKEQRHDKLIKYRGCMKIALISLLLIPVIATMSSCGDASPSSKVINSPVVIPYLVKNPIEVVTLEKTDVPEFYNRKITIKGLLDKDVEQSINDELTSIYTKTIDGELPPYRGIKQLIREDAKPTSNTIDSNMSYNYNNVASIAIYGNRSYDNNAYVGLMEAYNVDLNTGKQITLKDVFADDVDYKSILNDYISKLLMKSNSTDESDNYFGVGSYALKLVAPFKGIADSQKFFLYPGGLALIFDYSNPEFDTGLYATTFYVTFQELGDSVAIAERFYDPSINIFEGNKSPVFEFIPSANLNWEQKQNSETIDNINIYQSISYSKDSPEQAIIKAESLYSIDVEVLAKLKDMIIPSTDSWSSLEQYVWASSYGQYTNVTRNTSMYFNSKWVASNENYCFDNEGNVVELADIFVLGFDYKTRIMSGLKNAISQTNAPSEYNADNLYNSIQFSINGMDLSFTTEAVKFDEASTSPIYFALTYEEIGCENLMIFKK